MEERCHNMMGRAEVAAAECEEPVRLGVPAEPHHHRHHHVEIESCSPGSHARRSLQEDQTCEGTCSPRSALHQSGNTNSVSNGEWATPRQSSICVASKKVAMMWAHGRWQPELDVEVM
ncbi:hypothetical protein Scep_029682 [Stephania cephalantha]|uniref:Uncharacterized protein n=1 Tax=Stephania cephalantha TaxID=152367 RepID=A0AAP0DYD2_9MAGN